MHIASYEFLMKPKESAGCHQTLSARVGSGDETTSPPPPSSFSLSLSSLPSTLLLPGGIIMLLGFLLFESQFIHVVAITFTALIFTELLMVALTLRTWHGLMLLAQLFSIIVYILSLLILKDHFGMGEEREGEGREGEGKEGREGKEREGKGKRGKRRASTLSSTTLVWVPFSCSSLSLSLSIRRLLSPDCGLYLEDSSGHSCKLHPSLPCKVYATLVPSSQLCQAAQTKLHAQELLQVHLLIEHCLL